MNKEIREFFEQFTPEVAENSKIIFEITEKIMLPPKKMWIDHADKMITFGTEKNMKGEICYIKPLKDSVNLGFFHGANLNDPKKLLQGTGKLLRHVKFKKKENIDYLEFLQFCKAQKIKRLDYEISESGYHFY
ncbi:MAG: DUF1801 domain-containing protein [Leptospiraceae bacterium]|nr:DUF1801 domain-containing protein [Leptospiraceae bacterium]